MDYTEFPTEVLYKLNRLTRLDLLDIKLQEPMRRKDPLKPLHALTRLADLRLGFGEESEWANPGAPRRTHSLLASMLSRTCHLTRLELALLLVEPAVLAGKTELQHLRIDHCDMPDGPGDLVQLLAQLQDLPGPAEQLTYLNISGIFKDELMEEREEDEEEDWGEEWEEEEKAEEDDMPPSAAAFSALTASSKLQSLTITYNALPAGVWPHTFPAGKLPQLQFLELVEPRMASGGSEPPKGSLLASCCPGLRHLDVGSVYRDAEWLGTP
jgi:hypothetical protein